MEAAVIDLRSHKPLIALGTLEVIQPCVDLHEYLPPRHLLLLSQEHDELIHIPRPVTHMLGYHAPVEVYEDLGFVAYHPLPLRGGVEIVAIDASV